jgi:L-aminopeptidase/D-esterase-like protein
MPRVSGEARRRGEARLLNVPDLSQLGIAVGHATDEAGATGLTVVRGIDGPLRAGAAVFGRATGTRELRAASPDHLVDGRVDAILLTGGSAYGLNAASGVMRWCEEQGRGFPVGAGVVPIVPAAVVFDLSPLGQFTARPTDAMAYAAAAGASSSEIAEGSVGVGTGATVGKVGGPALAMKGGFGCAIETHGDLTVAGMAVLNAFGDVRDARGEIIAGARRASGGFADTARVLAAATSRKAAFSDLALQNTSLAVVAVNQPLPSVVLTQLARAAGAALLRRITPSGTSYDGDVVFALSPLEGPRPGYDSVVIETVAVAILEQAIERAVRLARGRDGTPGVADHGH